MQDDKKVPDLSSQIWWITMPKPLLLTSVIAWQTTPEGSVIQCRIIQVLKMPGMQRTPKTYKRHVCLANTPQIVSSYIELEIL